MDDNTRRSDDWKGEEWAGEDATRNPQASPSEHWNKEQWVGDQGSGSPLPQDPATMPEGDTSISGNRHTPGEQHWSPGETTDTTLDAASDATIDPTTTRG
jgi:hypothetical protein